MKKGYYTSAVAVLFILGAPAIAAEKEVSIDGNAEAPVVISHMKVLRIKHLYRGFKTQCCLYHRTKRQKWHCISGYGKVCTC